MRVSFSKRVSTTLADIAEEAFPGPPAEVTSDRRAGLPAVDLIAAEPDLEGETVRRYVILVAAAVLVLVLGTGAALIASRQPVADISDIPTANEPSAPTTPTEVAADPLLPFAPTRLGATAIWTGTEVLVWGGVDYGGDCASPAANEVDLTCSDSSAPAAASADGLVLTNEGALLSQLPAAPIAGRGFHRAVWTGSELVVWGGSDGHEVFLDGAAWSPESQAWRSLPGLPSSSVTDPLESHLVSSNGAVVVVGVGDAGAVAHVLPSDGWGWITVDLPGVSRVLWAGIHDGGVVVIGEGTQDSSLVVRRIEHLAAAPSVSSADDASVRPAGLLAVASGQSGSLEVVGYGESRWWVAIDARPTLSVEARDASGLAVRPATAPSYVQVAGTEPISGMSYATHDGIFSLDSESSTWEFSAFIDGGGVFLESTSVWVEGRLYSLASAADPLSIRLVERDVGRR